MSDYGKLYTLVICSSQLLTSRVYIFFNLRNKLTNFIFCNSPDFYFLTQGEFAPPYASLDLVQNLLSDWLWVPLLHMGLKWLLFLTSPLLLG